MAPLWRGERVEEKPEGSRAGSARGRCAHMDVRSATPGSRSRTRRAGCPESALLGVCFFRLPFFAQAKKGDSLARRASESPALQEARKSKELDSGFRRNDEQGDRRPSRRKAAYGAAFLRAVASRRASSDERSSRH